MSGIEYTPDIVTRLRGDNSDLNKAFAEATATEKAFEKSTEGMAASVNKSVAGMDSDFGNFASNLGRHSRKGGEALENLRRRLRRLEEDAERIRRRFSIGTIFGNMFSAGVQGGKNFASGLVEGVSGIGSMIVPILIGAVVLALPAIGALISTAIVGAFGIGFAALGVILAAKFLPKIQQQFYRIGQNFKSALIFAITGSFDEGLSRALRTFNRMIPDFGQVLRQIFDSLTPALDPLAQALGASLNALLVQVSVLIPQIMPALLELFAVLPELFDSLGEFLVRATADGPALVRFIHDGANALSDFLIAAGDFIGWLTTVYNWTVKLNDAFPFIGWQRQVIGLGEAMDALGKFFSDAWGKIVNAGRAVGEWFADLGASIWDWLSGAVDAVGDFVSGVIEWFQLLPGRVIGFLASMPGRVTAVVKDMAHRAAYWVGWLVGTWLRSWQEIPPKVIALIAGAWVWVQNKVREGVAGTIAHVRAFPGQVASFFMQLYVDVTGWVKRTWESVTGWFARTRQSMIEHIVAGINAVISWFRGLPDRAAKEATSFKDRMIKFFKGAKDWLYDAGKAVVRGLIDGITSAWDWAIDKVKSFGHDIAKGFKDALGIHSPSTVAFEAGEFFGQGFAGGVARSMDGVRNLWRSLTGRNGALGPVTLTGGGGTPGPVRRPPSGGSGDDGPPIIIENVLKLDGAVLVRQTTAPAQRRAWRSGLTGLGNPAGAS